MKFSSASLAIATLLFSGCASPPIHFYTLGAPAVPGVAPSLSATTHVMAVTRITLPDYLDTQDIVVRDGDQIDRSPNARWASRLSQGATDLLAARLAQSWPSVFVTTQPQSGTPDNRLSVNVSRLDITHDGQGTLEADWAIIPRDEHLPIKHQRAVFTTQGNVSTDTGNAALTRNLLEQLASRIAQTTTP